MSALREPHGLDAIFKRQRKLQAESFGVDPALLQGEERAQYVRDMTLACIDELHEALGEVGWKPWATSRHLNADAFGNELVDALHFLVNLFLVAGFDADEVVGMYMAKAQRNARRQAEGYDGVRGKCPSCLRALDDPSVLCTQNVCMEGEA